MKKNNNLLVALLVITICASPIRIFAGESYSLWDALTGGPKAISSWIRIYYNYKQNLAAIAEAFGDYSWFSNYLRNKKNVPLDKEFSKASQELYDRYLTKTPYKSGTSIKSAINLLKTIVMRLPEETFNTYKIALGSIAEADTKTKIDYYLNEIIKKLSKKHPNTFQDNSTTAFKHEFLQNIYNELPRTTRNAPLIMVMRVMLEKLEEDLGKQVLNESQRENLLKISFNKISPENLEKIFPTKKIPDSFIKTLTEVTEGLNSADIENFILDASKIAIHKNQVAAHIDYDCFARALWNIKQIKHRKQLPERSDREKIIDQALPNNQKEFLEYFLKNTNNMTLADLQEVVNKATKYATEKPEKSAEQWLPIVIEAQNKLLKIKQMRELINLCGKIYNSTKIEKWDFPEKIAQWTPDQRGLLSRLEPETIFKKFEKTYITDSYLKEYENFSQK